MLPQHLQLLDDHLLDQIRTMRNQENTTYRVSRDYFQVSPSEYTPSNLFKVTPFERKAMLTWAYNIVDASKIERHVAITAVSYLDRFLADNIVQCAEVLSSRRNYQLCFIACLIIAMKNCAGMKVETEFVTKVLCHGMYREKEILSMELIILKGLGWRLNGPTAIDFVHAFLQLLPNQEECKMKALIKTAEVHVELAMGDFATALQEPSSIACSSIILAMNSQIGKYRSGVEVTSFDRFLWVKSVALVASLNVEDLMMRFVQSRLIESSFDLFACDISLTSSQGSSSSRRSVIESDYHLDDTCSLGSCSDRFWHQFKLN